jgi:hypothetical protein
MRDRIILAACVLGALSVVGGIVLYNHSGDDAAGSQIEKGPAKRGHGGEGILIDVSSLNRLVKREEPDVSQPEGRAGAPSGTRTSMSPAGGAASAPAARPAFVSGPAPSACPSSLLGSVIGLLGALLGGGGC